MADPKGIEIDSEVLRTALTLERRARAAAEAELGECERILAALPVSVCACQGPEHTVVAVKGAWHRSLSRLCVGSALHEAFDPLDKALWIEPMNRVLETGRGCRLRQLLRGSDGIETYFDVEYVPRRNAEDALSGVLWSAVDVTSHVQARLRFESAWRESDAAFAGELSRRAGEAGPEVCARSADRAVHASLQDLLAAVPAAICLLVGPDFVFEYANPAYQSLVPGRALIGRKVADVFSEVDTSANLVRLRRVYETGALEYAPEVRSCYDRELTGDATDAFFTSILGPYRRADGKIVGVVATTLDVTQHVQQRDRLRALHYEAEAARHALQREKSLLATSVAERAAELAEANRVLAAEIAERTRAETQLRELLQRLATAREDEQRRVARDLHDQVGQTLTALAVAVQLVRSDATLSALTLHRLSDLQQLADGLAREVHTLALGLRPTVLDELGLQAAVAQLLSDFSTRYQVSTELLTPGLVLTRLPSEVETVLFRVVQEAVTNVARHARATRVTVILERRPGAVIAIVDDDGIGCAPEGDQTGAHLGWVGMRERTLSVGGTLEIESERGRGTAVIAHVPVM